MQSMPSTPIPAVELVAYGDDPDQVADLHRPAGTGAFPVVVLVHGGFWRLPWDRATVDPLARDLARRGIAAWSVAYRRVGQPGGGWPGTLLDVAAAADRIVGIAGVDAGRLAVAGHSAGGHLALWLAARSRLPQGAPGADPAVVPRCAVSLAGVSDLDRGDRDRIGGGAVAGFLGGSADAVPDRYAAASPRALLPLGVPQLLVHGDRDEDVPVAQSRAHAEAATRLGDEVELLELPGVGHDDVIDPAHPSWEAVVGWIARHGVR
jgi:acetyl esterase/lipase